MSEFYGNLYRLLIAALAIFVFSWRAGPISMRIYES